MKSQYFSARNPDQASLKIGSFNLPQLTLYRAVSLVVILVMIFHLFYLYENNWGSNFVTAYIEADAYYYFHKAWFSAFVSPEGGMLSAVVPFSPYVSLVSASFSVFGAYLWVPFAISAICISATSGLVVVLTTRLFHLQIGFLAGLLVALCGVFIFYSGLTVKSGFVLFSVSLSIYLGIVSIQERSYGALFVTVVVVTIATYDRDNLIVILLPLAIYFIKAISINGAICRHIFFTVGGILACWLAIKLLVGHFFGSAGTNLIGVNFYTGNAPGATGGYTMIHGISNDLIGLRLGVYQHLLDKYGKPPTFWQLHTYMVPECISYYAERPVDYLTLKFKHFLFLFSQYSFGHPEQYPIWRFEFLSTTVAIVDWRLIVSLCAVFFYRKESICKTNHAASFVLYFGALYAITIWIFLVTERYRLVLYVIYIPFAAWGLYSLLRKLHLKSTLLFIMIFCLSSSLNAVMRDGPGWVSNRGEARKTENKRKEANRQQYNAMQSIANENSYESTLALAEMLIRVDNCHDATLLALKAKEVNPSGYPDKLIALCRTDRSR